MPPKKKQSRPEPQHIAAFEGQRSRPGPSRPPRPARAEPDQGHQGREVQSQPAAGDPGEFFERLSEKVAHKAQKAAATAGSSATREITQKLTTKLDEAIADAMRAADTVGTMVRREVQAAIDDTLRNAVMDAMRIREQHLAQLALIDRAVTVAQDLAAVRLRLDAELKRSGLIRVIEADPELFDLVNPEEYPDSQTFEVITPAYVEGSTGRAVQRGEMRRRSAMTWLGPSDAITVGGEGREQL
ncbi:hypothetical protein [Kitasatospora sp. NPDC004289]